MIINVEVPINRYQILSVKPNAWQLLLDKSLNVQKGDTINIVEVDSTETPTGNSISGIVKFINCIEEIIFSKDVSLYYIIVKLGIGSLKVGIDFEVN